MTYKELKAGLNALMQTVFPMISDDPETQTYQYYGIEVIEGYETPCFFTGLTGNASPNNQNTILHRLTYTILYFPSEIDEIDIMDKVEKMQELFALGCTIRAAGDEERYIKFSEFDWDYDGTDRDILEMSVNLEYLTDIRKPETAETMQDATIIINGGTENEWHA